MEKIQNVFYLLKENVTVIEKRKIVEKTLDFNYLHKLFNKKGFTQQQLKSDLSTKYQIKLYFKKSKTKIKWKEFITTIVEEGEDILKLQNSIAESYIIIFYNKKTEQYFATTGGYAHITIQEIATHDFGIEILSRIVKAEDKALRSTKERSLTGGIQGAIKFFRNEYNLYENEIFGNIYNELDALLTKEQLATFFGFKRTELKSNSLCIAKNSFSIRKSISFKETLDIIEKCEKILLRKPTVEINSVEKINKSNKVLLQKLNAELETKIYENYLNPNAFHSVEISHKEFEKYFYANYSILTFTLGNKREFKIDNTIKEIQNIIEIIQSIDLKIIRKDFDKILNTCRIDTFDENGQMLTSDTLRNHFCSEITSDSKSYFLIEKDWYQIKTTFIEKINDQTKSFIDTNKYSGPILKKWDSKFTEENDYNASYIGSKDSLVFDKFTPQNIEVCDFLRWDKENIYLYHVKKGFNNSMRDLCSQVYISARKVIEDSKNKYIFIELLYNNVTNSKGTSTYHKNVKKQFDTFNKADFIKLFSTRKIIFVLSVLDTSKSKRELEKEIDKFNSNIAKFCLIELYRNMRNLGVEFQIVQIWN